MHAVPLIITIIRDASPPYTLHTISLRLTSSTRRHHCFSLRIQLIPFPLLPFAITIIISARIYYTISRSRCSSFSFSICWFRLYHAIFYFNSNSFSRLHISSSSYMSFSVPVRKPPLLVRPHDHAHLGLPVPFCDMPKPLSLEVEPRFCPATPKSDCRATRDLRWFVSPTSIVLILVLRYKSTLYITSKRYNQSGKRVKEGKMGMSGAYEFLFL